jgi:hypothetical protein
VDVLLDIYMFDHELVEAEVLTPSNSPLAFENAHFAAIRPKKQLISSSILLRTIAAPFHSLHVCYLSTSQNHLSLLLIAIVVSKY